MDKEAVVGFKISILWYMGILFNPNKQWDLAIQYNMDKARRNYANKPDTIGKCHVISFTYGLLRKIRVREQNGSYRAQLEWRENEVV